MLSEKQTPGSVETILAPGQIVADKYCVDRLIGKGGMAAVWAGTNQRTGKRVALKVILRSFATSGDAAELFRREAVAASRVNHPNVVHVFDVIEHDGMTCIVMELLDGEPFGVYLARKGRLAPEEAIALLLPAMRGVAAANAQGVIHRDLKPHNIFLCIGPDGRLLTTKVLDFGISVIVQKALEASTSTQVVTTHGTPAYMCPEHITGAANIDGRADVYGFGVLLFEALTGRLPFQGEPGPALLVRILNEPPPRLADLRPDLPEALIEVVERAMAKDPADRFQTLDGFIRSIEEYVLPPTSLPRSLTPMAGVPIFSALNEPKSGTADAVVQVVHRSEGSAPHDVETKALFTLPREPPAERDLSKRIVLLNRTAEHAAIESEASLPTPPPSTSTTLVAMTPPWLSLTKRLVGSRVMQGLAFVAVLAVVIWIAVPFARQKPTPPLSTERPIVEAVGTSVGTSVGTAVDPPVVAAPEVPAVPAAPAAPSPFAGTLDPLPLPEAALDPEPLLPDPESLPDPTVLSIPPAGKGARRSPARSRSVAKVGRVQADASSPFLTPPPTAAPPSRSAKAETARAGTLSPDDF